MGRPIFLGFLQISSLMLNYLWQNAHFTGNNAVRCAVDIIKIA